MEHLENNEELPENCVLGSIYYHNNEEIDSFIDGMTEEQALYVLIQSSKYSHSKNIFNMIESELISKSIRLLSK